GNLQGFSRSDFLTRTAGPTPTPDNPNVSTGAINTRTPFLGENRGVAPPAGFQQVSPGQPGYVPAPQITGRAPGDVRLGSVVDTANLPPSELNQPLNALPQPGELRLNGPTNKEGNQSIIAASTLFGIRQTTAEDQLFQPQSM